MHVSQQPCGKSTELTLTSVISRNWINAYHVRPSTAHQVAHLRGHALDLYLDHGNKDDMSCPLIGAHCRPVTFTSAMQTRTLQACTIINYPLCTIVCLVCVFCFCLHYSLRSSGLHFQMARNFWQYLAIMTANAHASSMLPGYRCCFY